MELQDGQVAGIAVHIAARVMAHAEPGRVLVSGTVTDLVVGSGIRFADLGTRALKGVPGEWRLFESSGCPERGSAVDAGARFVRPGRGSRTNRLRGARRRRDARR